MQVVVDGLRGEADGLWTEGLVEEWLGRTVVHSGLTVIAGPVVKQFEGVIHGWAVIAESHVSCHLDVLRGKAYLEMFSCREFDAVGFVSLSVESFGLTGIQTMVLPRSLP